MSFPVVTLSEVATVNPRKWTTPPQENTRVSFVPLAAVEASTGKLDASNIRPWPEVNKGFTRFEEGDVLFAKITPSMENGKTALAVGLHESRGVGSTEFHVLRPSSQIDARYLLHYLLQPSVRRAARAQMRGVAGQLRVPPEFLRDLSIPLPPLEEQKQIVAEIETQFARLDDAVAALKQARARLKRYRASVLKAACEGRLVPTEAELARQEGRGYEPASVLLERITAERAANGGPKRGKAKDVSPLDTSTLPELPEGWAWATLGEVGLLQGGIQKQPKRSASENAFPFLRVANVMRGKLHLGEIHEIELFGDELMKLRLEKGDLLIVEGNGSPDQIGRMAIWDGSIANCVHQNHIIRARLVQSIHNRYVAAYWNSDDGKRVVSGVAASTSGLYTLSVSKVSQIPIPIPPFGEQDRIVAEVERILSIAESQEAIVETNLKRAESLRQSILMVAFSGRLITLAGE